MKKFLILGAGLMGRAIAEDLIEQENVSEVVINDINAKNLEESLSWLKKISIKTEKIGIERLDATKKDQLARFIKKGEFDVVINALPHELSVSALEACVKAGISAIDLAFEDDQLKLNNSAKEKEITIIPGCGVAPGLSNMLAGYGFAMLDKVKGIYIKVGGLPQKPLPPLEYRVVFHLGSVWLEYTRPARIVKNGEIIKVESLSGVEVIEFPGIGKLECFYTDGITTLPLTFKDAQEIEEKTIRYPGHAEKIRVLRECGLFDTTPMEVKGVKISPREFLTKLLTPKLALKEEKDLTVMRVDVVGTKGEDEVQHTFELVDYYDEKKNITSMARTTGYTASIVAQLLAKGKIKERGVVPPEKLGMNKYLFEEILAELGKRGMHIKWTSKVIKNLS